MRFQDSSWRTFRKSSLVIPAASVLEIPCGKWDTQTNGRRWTKLTTTTAVAWVTSKLYTPCCYQACCTAFTGFRSGRTFGGNRTWKGAGKDPFPPGEDGEISFELYDHDNAYQMSGIVCWSRTNKTKHVIVPRSQCRCQPVIWQLSRPVARVRTGRTTPHP